MTDPTSIARMMEILDESITDATRNWLRSYGASSDVWARVREELFEAKLRLLRAQHLAKAWKV